MCGIAGFLLRDGAPAAEGRLAAMLGTLVHRGPDDEGRHLDGPLAFGTRRLSIIDLAGGHQPVSNEDGSVWAVLNGEIYNYRELRSALERAGHRFRSGSDTETLVHLYEERGEGFLEDLNGMFGLALWDARRRALLLARDRLGIKPLYYCETAEGLLFGSELKALLAGGVARELDPAAARDYALLLYVPAPASIIRGVRKLPPGHWLRASAAGVETARFWSLPGGPVDAAPLEDQVGRFQELFRDAVALQMRSDVPYGAFLSGGIDSSAVVGTMSRLSGEPVRTFSIGFSASRHYDELPFAREVARRFGTRHEEFVVEPSVFELLEEMAYYYDEPFADAAFMPTYMLAGLCRRSVKVALTGDGGDELFAGYDRYRSEALAEHAARLPALIRRGVLRPLLSALPFPADWRAADLARLAVKKLDLLDLPPDERYVRHFLSFSASEWERLQGERMRGAGPSDVSERYAALMAGPPVYDFLNRRMALDLRTWLPDQMLTKVDRATMGRGLEARVPFLDHRLVEFAMRLPQESKFTLRLLKRFLKLAFRELLPVELLHRRKHGFEVPVDEWLRGPLRDFARSELSRVRLAEHGLFEPGFVELMLREHEQRRRNRSRELFMLLAFQLWYRRWLGSPPAA